MAPSSGPLVARAVSWQSAARRFCAAPDAKLLTIERCRHGPVSDAAAVDPVLHRARVEPC